MQGDNLRAVPASKLYGGLEFGVHSDTVRGMSRPSDVARSG